MFVLHWHRNNKSIWFDMILALCSQAGVRCPSNYQTQTHPLDCQEKKALFIIKKTCHHCSEVQWWISPLDLVIGSFCLVLETYFRKLSVHLF